MRNTSAVRILAPNEHGLLVVSRTTLSDVSKVLEHYLIRHFNVKSTTAVNVRIRGLFQVESTGDLVTRVTLQIHTSE